MAQHNAIGKQGEELARKYLENKGYRILEQNYKTRRGEIDLVARYKNELIIVEVRTKVGEQFGSPEDTLTYEKKRRLLGNGKAYVGSKKYKGFYRIDAVCIVLRGDGTEIPQRISHHENIVQ